MVIFVQSHTKIVRIKKFPTFILKLKDNLFRSDVKYTILVTFIVEIWKLNKILFVHQKYPRLTHFFDYMYI